MEKFLFIISFFLVLILSSCDDSTVNENAWKDWKYKPIISYAGYNYIPEDTAFVLKGKINFIPEGEDLKNYKFGVFYGLNGDIYAGDPTSIKIEVAANDRFKYKENISVPIDTIVLNESDSTFLIKIKNLLQKTDYHFYLYAKSTNNKIGYSTKNYFTTLRFDGPPIVAFTPDSVSDVTYASVLIKGVVSDNGGNLVKFARVYYAPIEKYDEMQAIVSPFDLTNKGYTESNSLVNVSKGIFNGDIGTFQIPLVNLESDKEYCFRILVSNNYSQGRPLSLYKKNLAMTITGTFKTYAHDSQSKPIVTFVKSDLYPVRNSDGSFTYKFEYQVAKYANEIKESGIYYWERSKGKAFAVKETSTDFNTGTGRFSVTMSDFQLATDYVVVPYAIFNSGIESDIASTSSLKFKTAIPGRVDERNNDPNYYYELPGISVGGVVLRFLDRNLGASAVPDTDGSSGDQGNNLVSDKFFGWLFQWGRPADGHQYWAKSAGMGSQTSGSNIITDSYESAQTIAPGVFWKNSDPYSWLLTSKFAYAKTLWNGKSSGGINNPCPVGYRVPTQSELVILYNAMGKSWSNSFFIPLSSGENIKFALPRYIVQQRNASGSGYNNDATIHYSNLWSCDVSLTAAKDKIMASVFQWGNIVNGTGRIQNSAHYLSTGCAIRAISINTWPDEINE
jgi:hypothetical protein